MNKNQKLIKCALKLLNKVDKRTIKYKNSFRHYINEIESICDDYNKKKK